MEKIFYALSIITFLSLFSSCSKSTTSSSNNNNNPASDLVASYSEKNTTNGTSVTAVYTFSYDSQNRLIGIQYSNGNPSLTYTYGTGIITKTVGTAVTVDTLNSAGLTVSDNQGNTYTYNSSGYLTNITNPSGASTVNTISNNNLVNSVVTTSANVTTTYSYTFTSNKNTILDGFTFMGAADVNLIQSETISSLGTYPFTYTFDSEGRVQTAKIISGASTLLRTYTYVN